MEFVAMKEVPKGMSEKRKRYGKNTAMMRDLLASDDNCLQIACENAKEALRFRNNLNATVRNAKDLRDKLAVHLRGSSVYIVKLEAEEEADDESLF